MAFDAYLKIGDIPGESNDDTFKGASCWIDVLSFTYGVTQTGSASSQGGMAAGKANFQDFTFTQKIHKGSPLMFKSCASGKVYPEAWFLARKAGDKPQTYLQVKLKNVMITSVTAQGAGGPDEIPTETVAMTAEMMAVWYAPQKSDGSLDTGQAFGWDQKKNTAWDSSGLKNNPTG